MRQSHSEAESSYAWLRLAVSLALSTIGGVGMWSVVVALPAVQSEFGVARGAASLPYTLTMLGFGFASILMGRLADRFGIMVPVIAGTIALALGFGAVAIFASGNYLAGAVWPPIVQHFIQSDGWRQTYIVIGAFCAVAMLPLALLLRRPPPVTELTPAGARPAPAMRAESLGLSSRALQGLLIVAGLACCVAMSMPQVHLVAYCSDLGYGPARGAEMLSLMLACGIVSRLSFGFICDRIGGLRTLLLGSSLQGVALLLFLPFNGLVSLYVISALFGLFQGGIVPTYAIIVREYFPTREAGARVGAVITATLFGMALGGWMSGVIFDLTGSYRAAFINGILFNLLNVSIALFLLRRATMRPALA